MRIIKCDRCGKTIPNDLKPWAFAICDSNTGEPYPASPFKGWDFCLECKDEIIEFVKTKKKLETPEQNIVITVETPEKSKPKTAPLDKGKMLALRKAGWSLTEIAGECHCAVSTVSRILAELKEQENKKMSGSAGTETARR